VSDPSPEKVYVSIILPCCNGQDHVTAEVERIRAAMDAPLALPARRSRVSCAP